MSQMDTLVRLPNRLGVGKVEKTNVAPSTHMNTLGSSIRLALAAAGLALLSTAASAQANAPTAPPKPAGDAAERMQKAANQPLYWIKVLGDKPATKPAKPPAPATAQAAAAPRVATAAAAPAPANAAAGSVVRPARTGENAVVANAAPAPALALDAAPMETGSGASAGNSALAATGAAGSDAAPAVAAMAGLAAPSLAPGAAAATVPMPEMEPEPDAGLVLMSAVDPEFPQAAMRRLRKGSVEVRFEVAAEGQVTDVTVLKTSNRQLDDAAMDAVKKWRFKPSNRGHAASVELAFNMDT